MKLIIDIPEILFEKIQNRKADKRTLETVIMRGKPQEPKTGHWIDTDEGFSPCECSECKSVEFIKSKFCPNCGAEMKEGDA